MKRILSFSLLVAILIGTFGATAQAQTCAVVSRSLVLTPTPAGQQIGAVGAVKMFGEADCHQLFGAVVSARMPDGAVLTVVATTAKGTFKVAGMPMFLGTGQILLDNAKDVSEVFPVEDLRSFQVLYQKNRLTGTPSVVLLEASF